MPPAIATCLCIVWVSILFYLDRDPVARPAGKAIWVPTLWLLITGSRPVSMWFEGSRSVASEAQHNMDANPINIVVFAFLILFGIGILRSRRDIVASLLGVNWPIILFFVYCGISTVWSDYPGAALRKWCRSVGDLVVILILLSEANPVQSLKRVFARAAFILLPFSILLIKYYPHLGRTLSNSWELMYTGVTGHKNLLGAVCLSYGLGFLWRLREHLAAPHGPGRRRLLAADAAVLATIVWLLSIADSMTSTACLVMAGTLFIAATSHRVGARTWAVPSMMAGFVALALVALFFDSSGELVQSLGRNATLTGRTAIWQQVTEIAGFSFLGAGFESFWLGDRLMTIWSNNLGSRLNEAHNGYLEVYINLGWIGVGLLLTLIIMGYVNVMKEFGANRRLGGLKAAYFTAALIFNLTEAGFRMLSQTWIYFLFASVAVPRIPVARESPLVRDSGSARYWGQTR